MTQRQLAAGINRIVTLCGVLPPTAATMQRATGLASSATLGMVPGHEVLVDFAVGCGTAPGLQPSLAAHLRGS